jgi:ureidoglycolate hydrolase
MAPVQFQTSELTQKLFRPYGRILEPEDKEAPEVSEPGVFDFYVTFKESSQDWQIGYLKQSGKIIDKLECHPNTAEVFSPVSGSAVLILATDPDNENTMRAFKLTKPIVLNRGVWHGVISLSEKSEMLIVESPDVIDEFYQLPQPMTVGSKQ